jgi:uncharacterized membrane protein YgaE (UPF0421/DUF939 family)
MPIQARRKQYHNSAPLFPAFRSNRDELLKPEVAQLGAAFCVDPARVSALQFAQIQACGVAVARWTAEHVRAAAGAVHVLLAKVLLVYIA